MKAKKIEQKSKDKQRENALLLDTANHMDQHQCFVISQQEVKKNKQTKNRINKLLLCFN